MKRKVLGLLLILAIVPFFMGCDQETTTVEATTTTTMGETTTVEAALGTVTFIVYTAGDDPFTADTETEYRGQIIVVEFYEEDTLFDLLNANFTLTYEGEATDQYGRYLTSIGSIIPNTDDNEYVEFHIDGAYAMSGLDFTELTDGVVYTFHLGSF